MPSLLEALERKYFTNIDEICQDCANSGENDVEHQEISAGSCNDDPEQPRKPPNAIDVVVLSSSPPTATAGHKRGISIFIPRVSPLQCVPELLVLNDCDIDCAGDFESIKEKCQRVRELDLAQNKLHDWREVVHIMEHMPRVEFLNLSKNHLMAPISKFSVPTFQNLRGIVLNGTYLDWQSLDVLLENSPILEELHLSLNNYTEVLIDAAECDCCHANQRSAHINGDIDTDTNKDNPHASCSSCCRRFCYEDSTERNNIEPETDDGIGGCDDDSPPSPTASTTSASGSGSGSGSTTSGSVRCRTISAHKSLKALHFTGNPIESWHEICRLGRVFPGLENLVLAECPIRAIHTKCPQQCPVTPTPNVTENIEKTLPSSSLNQIPDTASTSISSQNQEDVLEENQNTDDDCPHQNFLNLTVLNLSHAHINTWDDIDRLAQFPKLRNLRIKNLPLWDRLECTEHERRQLLIARLPNVCLLNGGGIISADGREDSERAFIRYYMDKPEGERPKRYDVLIAKHGKLDPLVDVSLKPDKRVKVILCYNDRREARMVDVYRTVADFKVRLEKIVGLPANKMRLYYLDRDFREHGPELMKYPNKQLYSYNIQPGDEIIIDQKK